ncbi:Histidine triad nucleotide-binding protein 3 [Desmophyllum pertusum]|uniref:Adenosine 5'-monophosphoramidase HINT3 n=1 Tax=Desmophyllum pertusum TaxID=174260 RepID=A0A9W9ZGT4_9CNID|nr:Histidine triad nucleotide-binding protein 3 [Desmophyllum pertusum]
MAATRQESVGIKRGCIFCKIAAKEQENHLIYEDEKIAVFPDRRPAAKHHYLVIPKDHYGNPKSLYSEDHVELVERLLEVGKSVIADTEADSEDVLYGYHWPPFNSIQHLHLHVISPRTQMGFFARQIFKPNSFWFVTHDWLLDRLKKNPSKSS